MRTSIVWWSTISGALLGLFIDATLVGVALLLSAIIPGGPGRLEHRWLTMAALVVLVTVLVAMTVLGFLEGQLKAS
jgi:ABC-type multidrug transport system permease subunit